MTTSGVVLGRRQQRLVDRLGGQDGGLVVAVVAATAREKTRRETDHERRDRWCAEKAPPLHVVTITQIVLVV